MSLSAKHKTKRDHLLTMGINILWKNGYNGTSVKDIVSAAGVPKGSFYNYFESKEDFAVKALDKYFNEFVEDYFSVLDDESKSYKERLVAFYEYRVEFMLNHPIFENGCIANSLGNEMSNHSEAIRKSITEKESFVKERLIKIARKGREKGEINNSLDEEVLINFMEDAIKGAIITRKEYQSDQSMHNLLLVIRSMID